jgi:hypothetical protein
MLAVITKNMTLELKTGANVQFVKETKEQK